jgi:hypothetical protein
VPTLTESAEPLWMSVFAPVVTVPNESARLALTVASAPSVTPPVLLKVRF